MPPRPASKQQIEQRDELVSAFSQLQTALTTAAQAVETYTSILSKGGLTAQIAGEGYAASLVALSGGGVKGEAESGPVAGKKRGRPSAAATAGADEKGGKKRRMKKEKDPNAPKRPASAYLLYQNDKRGEFVEKYKGTPYHEMLSKISESWSSLTEEEKKPYVEAQAKLKESYEGKKKAYDAEKDTALAAAAAEEAEVDDEDELDTSSPAPVAVKPAAQNGEQESEDDDDDDEESDDAEQVANAIATKAKPGVSSDDDDDDEESDEESESSEDDEPPRKKTKGTAPAPKSALKKAPAQTPVSSKPGSKKAAETPAPVKDDGKKKRKKANA